MNTQDKINIINKAVKLHFKRNPGQQSVKPNELCSSILEKVPGLNRGKQVRDVLRGLDSLNQLHLIPSLKVNRLSVNRSWEFINTNNYSSSNIDICMQSISIHHNSQANRDEDYVLMLCDKVLSAKSLRQYRFDFLCGDTGVKLPVDAFYAELNLVVEYRERQHTEDVLYFDKPNKMTVSEVHRGEQRKKYDQRRREMLPKHGITLIEISYRDFSYNKQKRIERNEKTDITTIRQILASYI